MSRQLPTEKCPRCPVCGSVGQRALRVARDDRYGHEDPYPIVECAECGLAYLAERPAEPVIGELYRRYYPSPDLPGTDGPATVADRLKDRLRRSAAWATYQKLANPVSVYARVKRASSVRVLDVGSGAAVAGAVWVTRHLRGRWFGIDVNHDVCAYLAARGLPVHRGTLEEFAGHTQERFDYVLLSQVIEHVYEPLAFLDAARRLLGDGGRIVLSCPNYASIFRSRYGPKWLHWHVPYHVSQFSPASLLRLSARAGLRVEELVTVTPAGWFHAQREVLRGRPFREVATNSRPLLQVCLNLTLREIHAAGHGDAIVAVLGAA